MSAAGANGLETTRPTLLERLADLGDHDAWREFDERYRELILRYCQRSRLQVTDAEDVRQTVLLALTRRLPTFEYHPETGRFRDYLGTVVRNAIRKQIARQDRAGERLPGEGDELAAPDAPDESWNEEWKLHHYRRAMERIRASSSPKTMEIFDGLLAGRTVEELAAAHGATPDVVYKIKQRVRDRLRERIDEQLREEQIPRPLA